MPELDDRLTERKALWIVASVTAALWASTICGAAGVLRGTSLEMERIPTANLQTDKAPASTPQKSRPQRRWLDTQKAAPSGTRLCTFASKTIGQEVSYILYLPPGYEDSGERQYPVLYWLHGRGGTQFTGADFVVPYLDAAIRQGEAPPMIAVMVNGLVDGFYSDSPDGRFPLESVIINDLIPHVDSTYRTICERGARAVQGYSMGGWGAAHLGFKYPDLFGVICIDAGALLDADALRERHPDIFEQTFATAENYLANHPRTLIEKNADKVRGRTFVHIGVGEKDPLLQVNQEYHELLTALKIEHEYEVVPGVAHFNRDYHRVLGAKGFAFYKKAFAGEPPGQADSSQPGELRTHSTLHSIGIEWDMLGDADHDARCEVRYRGIGSAQWRQGLDLLRIDYYGWYGDTKADRAYNMLAGSVLFLEPGTAYEVELAMSDPDGGQETRTIRLMTRPEPARPGGGRVLDVVPGSEGGDGSPGNPFRGFASAQSAAGPGDVLRLHAGHYGSFTFDKPGTPQERLAWIGAGDGEAVLFGATVSASYVWLEGLTFRRGPDSSNGLVAKGSPEQVVISRNRFEGFHYSILLSGQSKDWYIADNTIIGDKQTLDVSDISGEGIELNHSSGHDVAFNRISHTADGISYPHRNCDLYANDIRDLTDDGIEPDYGYSNVRIWGNRIHCAFNNSFSFQPMYCGSWYILRNEVFSRKGMLKPNVADRFVLVNNTFVVQSRYAQGRADLLLKSLSRNNLWILIHQWNEAEPSYAVWHAGRGGRGGEYSMEYQPLPDWRTDVDYDGFDWDQTPTPFWWELTEGKAERFKDLASFSQAVGIEQHGLHVRREEIFEIQDIPAYAAEPFSVKRLTLKPLCAAIDAGQALANLCDDSEGRAPDLGAYEFGRAAPHYGPRTQDANMGSPVRVSSNPHWLEFRGRPILPIGDSVTQGWMESGANFDQRAYLDALAARGINVVLLWSYIATDAETQREDPRIGYDAPEIWPWKGSSGDRNFDLTVFNQAYFERLREFVQYADSRNIVVVITVQDGWPKTRFACHPFNAALGNGPLTDRRQFVEMAEYDKEMPTGYDTDWTWQQKNQYFQERFADHLISELSDCSNVIFEMFNEGEWYDLEQRRRHEEHFLEFFRKRTTAPLMTNTDHIRSKDSAMRRHPAADILSFHKRPWTGHFATFEKQFKAELSRVVFESEPVPSFGDPDAAPQEVVSLDTLRAAVWERALSGAGWVAQDDTSFGWDPKTGMAGQTKLRDQAYDQIGHAARFFSQAGIEFWKMSPDSTLASTGICLAEPGHAYVVYVPLGGQIAVDLSAAEGPMSVQWLNPRTGAVTESNAVVGGAKRTLFAPFDGDAVLHLKTRTIVPASLPDQAGVWQRWERTLISGRSYANPYADVTLRVIYTGPTGHTLQTWGFWDGGGTFRIRCAYPWPGTWRWQTECSDADNAGLHRQCGTVDVSPYQGDSLLYRHGFLKVSGNRRYLTYGDGTPFLWMGDTAWAVPQRASDEEWAAYLADRRAKHFTLIQVAPAPEWAGQSDRRGERPFVDKACSQWNPAYWQSFEQKVQRANEAGLVVLLVGLMEPVQRYPEADKACLFARNIVARLFGNFVIFSPSFDSQFKPLANEVGRAAREATAVHLITQHPGTPWNQPTPTFSDKYYDEPYMDIAAVQTGHNGGHLDWCAHHAIEWVLHLYRHEPHKPVINLEAMYDAQGENGWRAIDARSLAWRSWLSGAMGYTYGAGDVPPKVPQGGGAVWKWVTDPEKYDYWKKALQWPSAFQMQYLHDFLAGIEWWRLEPRPDLIRNQAADWLSRMVLAKSAEGDLAVAYLPDNATVEVDMSAFPAPMAAKWFDPVTGKFRDMPGNVANSGRHAFMRPEQGDWVLYLRQAESAHERTTK